MATIPEGNRFAPPAAHVEDVAGAAPGTLAGRGTRLGAVIIDGLLAAAVYWFLWVATPVKVFLPTRANGVVVALLENMLAGFAIFVVLQGYLLATRGQTIGKALLGLRIVRSDGSRASFARLVGLRYFPTSLIAMLPFVGWIYALADSLLIFRESHQCLHDNIADTIVVKA